MITGTLLNFVKIYEDELRVIFDQWPKLHLGLDALSNQKILKSILYRICQNVIKHPLQGGGNDEKSSDVIHINLIRPLVFVQPVAVDRAILFWLSYKNAWEYWTEQRLNLNKEVLAATEQVLEKVNSKY